MTIKPILPYEADDLSALIHRIYPSYFTYLWDDDGAWYLAYSYNPVRLRSELADPNVRYFWAITNGEPVGYLKINLDKNLPGASPVPAAADRPLGGAETSDRAQVNVDGLEIERIYFLPKAAGQGLGTLLIAHAEGIARERGKRYVWLHVMDSSLNSVAFYEKRGFEHVGETWLPFEPMKPEYRRMWQMKKRLH